MHIALATRIQTQLQILNHISDATLQSYKTYTALLQTIQSMNIMHPSKKNQLHNLKKHPKKNKSQHNDLIFFEMPPAIVA